MGSIPISSYGSAPAEYRRCGAEQCAAQAANSGGVDYVGRRRVRAVSRTARAAMTASTIETTHRRGWCPWVAAMRGRPPWRRVESIYGQGCF